MQFSFYSPRALEPWDWRNLDEQGIGNSETSHVEMALRLAKRGHQVTSYTKLSPEFDAFPDLSSEKYHGDVHWCDLRHFDRDIEREGVWALYRCPEALDRFPIAHPGQQLWLIVQDTNFVLTDRQAQTVDRVVCLCEAQAASQKMRSLNAADKVCITSNGIRVDMIEEEEAGQKFVFDRPSVGWNQCFLCGHEWRYVGAPAQSRCPNWRKHQQEGVPTRNPHRLHFSSSPDRGLAVLLERIFPRVREVVPDAELHVYYGFNNIDVLLKQGDEAAQERARKFFSPSVERVKARLTDPGVVWHGRTGQRALTREWLKAGVWAFPSLYPESSCASVMEAQALGVIPVSHPLWGVGENTKWGTLIPGDPYGDRLTQARYVAEIVRLMTTDVSAYRRQMMADARRRFSWDNWVTQWDAWADGREMSREAAMTATREALCC